jgi:DNA replication protein DnaC
MRVKFYSVSASVQQLQEAKQVYTLQGMLNKLDKYEALIVDDISYVKKINKTVAPGQDNCR